MCFSGHLVDILAFHWGLKCVLSNIRPVKAHVCMCVSESAHVYMHMYLWVCALTYVYICMCVSQMAGGGRWGCSGGIAGVKHLCGSKPRSGQLQRPMFKVNGGLRWLFISRLLHSCWTPSATAINPHHPLAPPFSRLCPRGPVPKIPVHRDQFCAVRNPTQRMRTHTHAHT